MCLDVDYIYNNRSTMKLSKEKAENGAKSDSEYDVPIKSLCGGSLIEFKPVFDPKGNSIYVVWNEKVRIFSIETGECIRDLDDNKDGSIVGLFINNETQKTLVGCTKNGTVLTWKLDSFVISKKLKLDLAPSFVIKRFVLTIIDGLPHGIICFKDSDDQLKLVLVELEKGKVVQSYQIPFLNEKKDLKVRLADGSTGSTFFVATQKNMLYIIDKSSKNFVAHANDTAAINVVICHPEEEMVATGDVMGKIKLWRNIFDPKPVKAELHWHHMIVLSLAFSQSGTILYSGGAECVLVKWQIKEKSITKEFLPRLPASIKQISVDRNHDKISISLDDNAIQIINSSLSQLQSIQDFTQASRYDLGMSELFPAGIKINPRKNQLVMNGRIGHLQFFSTKNMKLLYNVDIAMRNAMPREKKKIIFSTQVTVTAFTKSWMATVESWNDKVNSPESRLKFWKYLDGNHSYSLHTQIEQAHVKEITALEFSGMADKNGVICASVGLDRLIKIWSLEKMDDVKSARKIWMCIEELSFKNLPIESVGFSQDSSLIAAGFGNVLCVWDAVSFKLKCSLSAPAQNDGSVNRVLITLPAKDKKASKKAQESFSAAVEKRRKVIELMRSVIDGSASDSIVKNITLQKKKRFFAQNHVNVEKPQNLSKAEKEEIFSHVLSLDDLSFRQKIEILHKLNIYYKISNRVEQEVTDFIARTSFESHQRYKTIYRKLLNVKSQEKFKVQWRFRTWNMHSSKRNRKFVSIRKLLNHKVDEALLEKKKMKVEATENLLPIKNITHISNVIFCAEECSHLIIVTTPERLLIWNLLTLKIQGSFKLHTKFITLDRLTNLVAVFTKYNELFIFHPNPVLTIHQQKNVPDIYGAIWVPRDNPRVQTVNVNWQAKSQLIFLNHRQEVCSFKIPGDEEFENAAPFMELSNGFATNTPFAAMIAQKITDETTKDASGMTKRIAVSGSGAVKDIINLSSHAMPPMRLLSKEFIGSMLSTEKMEKVQRNGDAEVVETMVISDDENDPDDDKIIRRKAIEKEEKVMKEKGAKKKEAFTSIESRIKNLKLDFVNNFEL